MVAEVTELRSASGDTADKDYNRRLAPVPEESAFGTNEYVSGPFLETIAKRLIEEHDLPADEFTIDFLWKRKSGNSGGKPVLGACQKLSGLTKHFSDGADFVVWISANHVRDSRMTNYQLEALLFHQLLHIDMSEDDDGEFTPILKSHEFSGFKRELEVYGEWQDELKNAGQSFAQARLIPEGFLG